MRPYQQKLQRRKRLSKKHFLILLGVMLLIVGVIAVLEITNNTHFFHDKSLVTSPNKPNRTQNANTKGETADDKDEKKSSKSSSSQDPADLKDHNSNTPTNNQPPKKPTGTFVSNHHPNLSGRPAPNEIQSTCETSAGVQCQIIFTKDGVTKSLPAQTTDRGGAAYWTWKLQDIGLTEGSWKVTAKATNGSQSATADDAINLEVKP